ncbi:family 16 glycosylhydrolase [Noviherbaspirillum pedocola]|uniref:Beta-glucanase n=1 Tax=Noviherbaspirillum pedocola TaxID=2801341 RepID=A0A934STJ7_9BURK|nr:family 16 glycosylhydrolase [Noviherbaspirillum pedocola]MBK4735397.1 family 16 glycosylhydrolase [Noviherbaspirillum pedocola]
MRFKPLQRHLAKLITPLLLIGSTVLPMSASAQSTQVFFDDFTAKGSLGSAWQVSSWVNGHPFGCTFSTQDVSVNKSLLTLSFSGNSGKCAEVRTVKSWQYGSFSVSMKPANVAGTVSSFFLYTGVAGTSTHYEIDIEFLGGSNILHTNYWLAGQQYPLDIDLSTLGINPYKSLRKYGYSWTSTGIAWYVMTDAGQWLQLRQVAVPAMPAMQLMMNAWYGDNLDTALQFPGYYAGQAGSAQYDSVSISQ